MTAAAGSPPPSSNGNSRTLGRVDVRLDRGRHRQEERQRDASVAPREQPPGRIDERCRSRAEVPCRPSSSADRRRASRADTIFILTPWGESRQPFSPTGGASKTPPHARRDFCAPASTVHGMETSVETSAVTKRYGARSPSTSCRSSCGPGSVTGFVGRAAPETTTMQLLLGLAPQYSQRALIREERYSTIARPLTVVGALLDARASIRAAQREATSAGSLRAMAFHRARGRGAQERRALERRS